MTGAASRHGRFGARPRKEALGADAVDGPALAVEIAPLTSPRVTGERNLEGFLVCSLDTTRSIDLDLDMVVGHVAENGGALVQKRRIEERHRIRLHRDLAA